MPRRLSDDAIRYLGVFEAITGVEAVDCLVDDEFDRVVFVVVPGELAEAVGPGGETVRRLESRVDRDVSLVEAADDPADFVANALRPAAVYAVSIDDGVARAEVAEGDMGAAIGRDGRTVELARQLAERHFGLDDVQVTPAKGDV